MYNPESLDRDRKSKGKATIRCDEILPGVLQKEYLEFGSRRRLENGFGSGKGFFPTTIWN